VGRSDHPGKRKTKDGKTQREVKEWLLDKRKELAEGLFVWMYPVLVDR
jgi:hypothetical protein